MPMTAVESKPSRKWSKNLTLQRRQEKYAAMGPLCRNGHEWAKHEARNHRGYRYCKACLSEKADLVRNDPTTYTGHCSHGHPYDRENTLITTQAAKVCRACAKASKDSMSLRISPARIQMVLEMAREGMHASEIAGRNLGKKKVINSIVSQNTLVKLTKMDTPEGREIKALLEQNSFRGRKPYKWRDAAERLLADEAVKSIRYEDIAERIKRQTGVSFSVTAVMTKA